MLKSSRRFISILLLIFLIFFSLVGCGTTVDVFPNPYSHNNSVDNETNNKEIYAPIEISYVIDNPLQIENIDVSESDKHQRNYFQISGLVDKTVENTINHSIKSLFEQMLPYATGEKLPPFRGIAAVLPMDIKINDSSITVRPQFNSNNVLSVVANAYGTYFSDRNIYFSVSDTINFDLRTGKTFSIEAFFTDDADGLTLVNDAITEELTRSSLTSSMNGDPYSYLNLVAPFKGISANQKFYISNSGLNVIIDHNNPEFEIGFYNQWVNIPFFSANGQIAITERFYDENSTIFTKEAVNKRFLYDFKFNKGIDRDSFTKNGIQWYVSKERDEDLPNKLIEEMDHLQAVQDKKVTVIAQHSPVLSVEQGFYANHIGAYYNISGYLYIGRTNDMVGETVNYVYYEDGELVKLEELFVEGYDYLTFIRQALEKAYKENGRSKAINIEDVKKNLMFRIEDTYISFFEKMDVSSSNQSQIIFHIPYQEFGFNNLTIFDN